MYLIKFKPNDKEVLLPLIKEIEVFDSENILPYVNDSNTIICGIIEDENKVVAFGISRLITEFKVIVNPQASNFKIAKAIGTLIDEAQKSSTSEIISRVTKGGEHYIKLLEKHFGFIKTEGILLKKEL